jgi:hypothetical protein
MHFLLLLLRLVLDRLVPGWRDRLTMAARADGRIEHLPTGPALWDRWLSFTGRKTPGSDRQGRKVRARWGAARARSEARSE